MAYVGLLECLLDLLFYIQVIIVSAVVMSRCFLYFILDVMTCEMLACLFFVLQFNVPVNTFHLCRDGASVSSVLTQTMGFNVPLLKNTI